MCVIAKSNRPQQVKHGQHWTVRWWSCIHIHVYTKPRNGLASHVVLEKNIRLSKIEIQSTLPKSNLHKLNNRWSWRSIQARHETEKNQKKRKIATCEGAQRPNLKWGWVREGGSPSRRKFCNFRYWKSCFNAEKNQKKRKIATCEGAQRPNLLGVGLGGGFPLPQKILQF